MCYTEIYVTTGEMLASLFKKNTYLDYLRAIVHIKQTKCSLLCYMSCQANIQINKMNVFTILIRVCM